MSGTEHDVVLSETKHIAEKDNIANVVLYFGVSRLNLLTLSSHHQLFIEMKYRWLRTVLFVITNVISPVHLTLGSEPTEFQHPVFTECKENRYCEKNMEASGSFSCVIRDVTPDVRLTVITNSTELNIYFQKESIITTDGVSNVTLQSNFTTKSGLSKCNGEFMVTCKAIDRGPPSIQIGSTARLGILIACEKPLSIEEKVWLAAITLFPFLWAFTLVVVCYVNKKNIFRVCRHERDYSPYNPEKIRQSLLNSTRRMSLTIRPRRVEDIDGERNDKSIAYVYFIDDRSCYAVSAKSPHKSIKLVLEKKKSRTNEQAASELERTSPMKQEDIELSVLETIQDSSVHDSLVQDSSVQDSTTPEKRDIQQQSSVTDNSMMDSVTELDRKASTSSNETLDDSLEWCRCGKCQELPEKHKVCCRRTYGECVTDDPLFYQLVTDRNTLQAAMIQWNDDQVASRFEAMAYKEYIYWQMGVTQNYSKVIIPLCVVKKVQSRYPKDSYGHLQKFLSLKI